MNDQPTTTADMIAVHSVAISIARTQLHVREKTKNRSPDIDRYWKMMGVDPSKGYPWCAAFVWWCYARAALEELGVANPHPRTGRALQIWRHALQPDHQHTRITPAMVEAGATITPGSVFVISTGRGRGHCGLVIGTLGDGRVITIEGNTDMAGDREGDGVYQRNRTIRDCLGFVDYTRARGLEVVS